MCDILKYAVKNIFRKKGRSILIIIGISIGVTSVVIISNISNCGTVALNNELNSLGLGGVAISTNASPGKGDVTLSENELNIIKKVSNVKNATPVIMQNVEVCSKKTSTNALLWGIDSKANQIISLKTLYGRSLNQADVRFGKNVCVVDQNFSKSIYKRDNIVGKKVSININDFDEDYEIVGVIKTGSGLLQNIMGDYIPNFIYVPYTTIQNITGKNTFDQVAVKIDEKADVDTVSNNILGALENQNSVTDGYKASNFVRQRDGILNLMDIVTIVLSLVGAISLLVASLSIMTVMLVSVNERKREIGIKKSIGAKRKTIMVEFLAEALTLTALGSILGLLIGLIVSYIVASLFGIKLSVRTDIILLTLLFSLVSGTVFGIYPAAKASKLKPVDTLRVF